MDVYFNASALLGPRTGIGQYCLQLMSEVRNVAGIRSHYFYLGRWSDELLRGPASSPGAVRRSKLFVAEKIPQVANLVFELAQMRNSSRFAAGVRPRGSVVYHEPNFLSYRSRLPTVVTVHDLSVLRYPETHPRYRVAVFAKRLRDSVRQADCIITDSEYIRQEVIAEFGLPADKVVATLLAASGSFQPMSGRVLTADLQGFGLAQEKYILAVGTLEPRKNLATAIKAYARLPEAIRNEVPFVIAGMKGWRMEEFDRHTAALIESGQIRRLGYVPDEMLPVLYSGARLFVYPSLYEGFGLPPLEAMACGAAVIVSNRSSLPEVVGDAGLQVAAMDADALASAMLAVIEDDELRLSLGRSGIARAAQFSWRRCAEQTVDVYRRVIG
jgi:glycosyltransferase involved in cell wall biosynthesis